jgi:hypothetical protein
MSHTRSWRARTIIFTMAALVAFPGAALAQTTTTQTVSFQANAINVIAVTGSPSLVISTAVAGMLPSITGTATWAVTTNQTGSKITARINTNMAAGLTLSANMDPPAGAVSTGLKALTTVATDMVTGITEVAQGGLTITYQFDATLAANPTSGSKTVTFTITGGV